MQLCVHALVDLTRANDTERLQSEPAERLGINGGVSRDAESISHCRRESFARSRGSRLLLALCGCLAIFGVISSTVFPLSPDTKSPAALIGILPAPPCCARRRNRKADADILCPDVAASYSRFSSDQQDAKSIGDQQRPCRERAERDGNHIPDDLQFADEAVSGTKLKRDGFDRMLKAAEEGRFRTLYFFDLSRLGESVITITTLKKLVYVYRVRVVSVSEGIDSANDGWFTLATILGLQHEQYLKTLRERAARLDREPA